MKRALIGIFVIFLLSHPAAQTSGEPEWLILERCVQLINGLAYGDALFGLTELTGRNPQFSEAQYWIGKVFEIEGELTLAEKQYRKAYELRSFLYIPDFEYTILYTLADLYERQKNGSLLKETLNKIVESAYDTGEWSEISARYSETLRLRGFEKVVELYRSSTAPALEAHLRLGSLLQIQGDPVSALPHLTAAVLIAMTTVISEQSRADSDYTFTTLDGLLDIVEKNKNYLQYALNSGLFQGLYYLGEALAGIDDDAEARAIWWEVAKRQGAGEWRNLTLKKLGSI